MAEHPQPIIPNYAGPCVSNIVPALLEHPDAGRPWMPEAALDAKQVVLFVIDGLGAEQLAAHAHIAPTLASLTGTTITTVAPSTTSAALTSIVTGVSPAEHGIIGYRIRTGGETLNVLRWNTGSGDARERIPAASFQTVPAFGHRSVPVITKQEFAGSGFTQAHLAGTNLAGYKMTSTLIVEVQNHLDAGAPFIYAYYDGIDKIAHEYGFGAYYEQELAHVDRLVADLLATLPDDAALLITADHGQLHIGDAVVQPHDDLLSLSTAQSGEARFRWLHAAPGRTADLAAAARQHHRDVAWIMTAEEVLDRRIFGPRPIPEVLQRIGDVALIPFKPIAFVEPTDTGKVHLIGRHGSLTSAEMHVPLLVGTRDALS